VLLESWPLEASLRDGEVLAGPVPSLFSEDVKSSEDALIGNITQRIAIMKKIRLKLTIAPKPRTNQDYILSI